MMIFKINYTTLFCSILFIIPVLLLSCSINRKISKHSSAILLSDSILSKGHIGISIFDPSAGKYVYNHNATNYFIPASNTKLFTLYAGMHFLGDSLAGLRYMQLKDTIYVMPTADPGFMHPDFSNQPVNRFFESLELPVVFSSKNWKTEKYGNGWAWDDYNDNYMAERSAFPVHGNLAKISFHNTRTKEDISDASLKMIEPKIKGFSVNYHFDNSLESVIIKRKTDENIFDASFPAKSFSFEKKIPFITNGITTALEILHAKFPLIQQQEGNFNIPASDTKNLYSQLSDSLFSKMMHNSDNFFAEQTLLMASDRYLGYMNERAIIDTLLKTILADVPQKPKWTDGSGLSRYNLFTPQSFIYILNKSMNEFGLDRLKFILPAGNEGILKNYFISESQSIFAKTGTLSNNASLSGFLITKKGKLLIFSIMANNYPSNPGPVRATFENFLLKVIKNF